jgi:NADH-quinone oxidoreductase subunit D
MVDEYNHLLTGNEILQARLKNIGVLSAEDAINYGVTGPNLRASGVDYDLRKAEPYGIYDRFAFDVPLGKKGDNYDRFMVRLREIEQSGRIITQALDQLPEGEIRARIPRIVKPKKGRKFDHRIETAKGELGYYIVSNGEKNRIACMCEPLPIINLMVLPPDSRGGKLQIIIANIATLDPVSGEADR